RLRDMRRVSERFHRIEGVLYAWGRGVKPGARFDRPTQLDFAPTVLALEGIPASRQMPGRVLSEGFTHLSEPKRIASYETSARPTSAPARDAVADQEQLAHLRSLGYLGGGGSSRGPGAPGRSSPQADRNLAAIAFQEGHFPEAERLYRALVAAEPQDAGLRSSLAGVLGALGRYDEAM